MTKWRLLLGVVVCLGFGGNLDADDGTFNAGAGANGEIEAVVTQATVRGGVDGYFNTTNGPSVWSESSAYSAVISVLPLAPGRVIVGGRFTQVEQTNWPHLARLNADGSLDRSFTPRPNRPVYSMLEQPDGRILIGGEFNAVNGQFRDRVARLEADGTLDTNFQTRLGLNGIVHSMALQPDGKVILGGVFSIPLPGGGYMYHVARLHTDGAVDFTFNPGTNFFARDTTLNYVRTVMVLPDGKILVGGSFHRAVGSTKDFIARLLPDGNVDSEYLPMRFGGPDGPVHFLVQAPGEVIFAAGLFTNFNGLAAAKIARLFPDGSLDESFRLQAAPVHSSFNTQGLVTAFCVDGAGRVTVAYSSGLAPNIDISRIHRYLSDGGFDTNFANLALSTWRGVHCMASLPDGGAFIGGSFEGVYPFLRREVARLLGDLPEPPAFSSGAASRIVEGGQRFILTRSVASAPTSTFRWLWNGEVLPGATNVFLLRPEAKSSMNGDYWLTASNQFGISTSAVITVTVRPAGRPGSVVPSFIATPGPDSNVLALAEAPDGKVYVGGHFTNYHGAVAWTVVRIHGNGALDGSYVHARRPYIGESVPALLPLEDSTLLTACRVPSGTFSVYKFRGNGSFDPSWRLQYSFPRRWYETAFSPVSGCSLFKDDSGRIYVAGPFELVISSNPDNRLSYLVRLFPDGSLDRTFAVWPGHAMGMGYFSSAGLSPDSGVIMSGDASPFAVSAYNFNPGYGVVRLNPLGVWDETFDLAPRTTNHYAAHSFLYQNDDRLLVTGGFSEVGTNGSPGFARFFQDGTLDTSFVPWSGAGRYSFVLAVQPDRKILAVTDFKFLTNFPSGSNRLVRLNPDGSLDASFDIGEGPNGYISKALVLSDGNILVGGQFSRFSGFHCHNIALLRGNVPSASALVSSHTNISIVAGEKLLLVPQVEGFPPPQWQWLKNGVAIPGATQTSFRLRSVGWDDAGIYSLVASNASGISTSVVATVSVQAGRLNADWADPGFSANTEPDGEVHVIVPQPDGRILIGGEFRRVGSAPRPGIARLLADGRLDEGFVPSVDFIPPSTNGVVTVSKVVLMPDGKIAVLRMSQPVGYGFPRGELVRLLEDGRIDSSFPILPVRFPLLAMPDGRLLVQRGEAPLPVPLRMLLPDGTEDPSFVGVTNYNPHTTYEQASLLPGGKLMVRLGENAGRGPVERLMSDGSRDVAFDRSLFASGSFLDSLYVGSGDCLPPDQVGGAGGGFGYVFRILAHAVQPDGRILVGGQFTYSNSRANLLRLLPDGGIDPSFTAWYGTDYSVRSIAVQPDGKILIGGCFTNVVNLTNSEGGWTAGMRLHLARLNPDGSLDASFNPAPTMRGTSSGYVRAMALQPDGRVLIGGLFDSVNGVTRRNFARLNGDLVMFQTISAGAGFSTKVATVAGRTYFLETRGTLDAGEWEVVDSEPGMGAPVTLSWQGHGGETRYYRVRVE